MSEPLPAPLLPPADHDVYDGRRIRWGFLGAGTIAGQMAEAIADVPGNEVVAVAARDASRAAAFAQQWNVPRSYGDYLAVCEDPQVDIVYVNTTHPHHHRQALMVLDSGKHVLVEHPLTLNATQATQVLHAARDRGLFSMEAMWMRTQPLIREVERLVGEGAIGDIVRVGVDFPVAFDYEPGYRLFDRSNGGGALVELGAYGATFAWLLLGQPETVQVIGSLAPTGVDRVVSMQWGYSSGATASVFCTSQASGPRRAVVMGRTGWITVEPDFARAPDRAIVHIDGAREQHLSMPSRRYQHQVEEVERCLRAGVLESPLVPHTDSIGILEVLDAVRSELGVRYPQE